MFKNKKVIIFDMDGTLIDSIGVWNEIDYKLIETIRNVEFDNVDIGLQREKVLEREGISDIYLEYCRFLGEKYESTLSANEIFYLRQKIADLYRTSMKYKKDADKLLHLLKEKGFVLALATTTTKLALDAYNYRNLNMMKKAKIYDVFSVIYSKEDINEKKPNPEVHYKILDKLKVRPEECLVIEDSLIGVKAARNANIEVATIYDKYSDKNREEINVLADYNFNTFEEMIKELKRELK